MELDGDVECFRVMSMADVELAVEDGEIACSSRKWETLSGPPYQAHTTVFVFGERADALSYLPVSGRGEAVLVRLRLDRSRLEPDRSADRDAIQRMREAMPGIAIEGCSWESSLAHDGPIAKNCIVEILGKDDRAV